MAIIAAVSISAALAVFASLIGISGSGEQLLRLSLHVAIANAGGYLLSRSIERRERTLFLQRLETAEAARREALASASKTRLLAAIGHDYRQPLSAILRYVEELTPLFANDAQRPTSTGQAAIHPKESLSRIRVCAQTLRGQLTRMLEYASLDQDDRALPMQTVDIRGLFERLRDVYEPFAAEHRVQLRIVLPDRGEVMVLTHAERLWECLANLVANAVRFSNPAREGGCWVLVRATRLPETVRIRVRDNGIGMDGKELERIWETGYRVRNGETMDVPGFGLGLAQVDSAIRRLPGHRRGVRSAAKQGSCFVIDLPRVVAPKGLDGMHADTATRLNDSYVLLWVASPYAHLELMRNLAAWGVSVDVVSRAEEVFRIAESSGRIPDVLLLDSAVAAREDRPTLTDRIAGAAGRIVPVLVLDGSLRRETTGRLPQAALHRLAEVLDEARTNREMNESLEVSERKSASLAPGVSAS